MNYFRVEAKCGHVGRNKFILKNFFIKSENKKSAAQTVINFPRVKHNHKDVIRVVENISKGKYIEGITETSNDMYFNVTNSTDQKRYCLFGENEIKDETINQKYRKKRHKRYLVESVILNEMCLEIRGGLYYE